MKKITLFAVLLCLCITVFSQSSKVNNNWYFNAGNAFGVTFNPSNSPSALSNSQASFFGTSASVSDQNGNPLFYMNGNRVISGSHNFIGNLVAGSAGEAIIVPNPQNQDQYYVFYASLVIDPNIGDGYNYAIINAPDGNNVSIVSDNNFLRDENGSFFNSFDDSAKRIAAYYDQNLDTIWVMVLSINKILTYQLDSTNGLNINPIQVSTSLFSTFNPLTNGSMKVSPDGTKIALTLRFEGATSGSDAILVDFDSSTGVVSNPASIFITHAEDIEFSPDSNTLYLRASFLQATRSGQQNRSFFNSNALYSYPISTTKSFGNTPTVISSTPVVGFGNLQLGPDDKIYFNNFSSTNSNVYLGVIDNPNDFPANLSINHQSLLLGTTSLSLQADLPDRVIDLNQEIPFITTWTVPPGDTSITIPTFPGETYSYIVDWGDGSIPTSETGDATHTYTTAGTYTVTISGLFPRIYFNNNYVKPDYPKITEINEWGSNQWSSMEYAFAGCANLTFIDPSSEPDLSAVQSMSHMFDECTQLNSPIDHWDVTNVTDMSGLFYRALIFNQSLNNWDVLNVTDMSYIFYFATQFNQPLTTWDVASVTDMTRAFSYASTYNQSLNGWNVINVTNMSNMFTSAQAFNQPLSSWDVSNVTTMSNMFYDARDFNQSLNSWTITSVVDMGGMFARASSFNQPLNGWIVDNVTNMGAMFLNATSFNQPLNSWNVGNVTWMAHMFNGASSFNQPLNSWNVENVTGMRYMFTGASSFNQPLNNWRVDNVTSMERMFFEATIFNQPLNNWIVSNVTDMEGTFYKAFAFNQSLGSWNIGNVTNMNQMLYRTNLSRNNYEDTLEGWAALTNLQTGVSLGAYPLEYCSVGSILARQTLTNTHLWAINGDNQIAGCRSTDSSDKTFIANNELNIYPNPFKDQLHIKQDLKNTITKVTIYNNLGNIVAQQKVTKERESFEINTSSLSRGIYFIKTIFKDGTSKVKQIVKD